MKNKKGLEISSELGTLAIIIVVLVILSVATMFLLKGRGGNLWEGIRNFMRFGRG